MYCKNCGTQLDNDILFCPNCGTAREPDDPVPNNDGSLKNSTVILIAAVMIVLMIGATVGTVIHLKSGSPGENSGYKSAVAAFINAAYRDFSIDEVTDLMNPDVLSYAAKSEDISTDTYKKNIEKKLKDFQDDFTDGTGMTYKITSEKVFDEDVDDINEDLREGGYHGSKVTEYAIVEVELNYSDGYSEDDELMLLKIGKNWYVSSSDLLYSLYF